MSVQRLLFIITTEKSANVPSDKADEGSSIYTGTNPPSIRKTSVTGVCKAIETL